MPCLISYSEFQTDTTAENLYDLKKMYLQKKCLIGSNIQTIKSRGSQMGGFCLAVKAPFGVYTIKNEFEYNIWSVYYEDVLRCLSGGVRRGRVWVVYIIYVLR